MILMLDRPSRLAEEVCRKAALKDPRVRIQESKTPGLASTLNHGLEVCEAELIARLDQDDLMAPNRLEKQVAKMGQVQNLVCLGSQVRFIDTADQKLGKSKYPTNSAQVRFCLPAVNCIAHPSVIYRKSAVQKIGGYNGTLDGVEDYNLWLRLLSAGKVANDPECLTYYRLHPKQMSRENKSINKNLEGIARIEALTSVPIEGPSSWAKKLEGMSLRGQEQTVSQMEKRVDLRMRGQLKSFRLLSDFFTSNGINKLRNLVLALLHAPLRSSLLLALLFYFYRLDSFASKKLRKST
jgi:glycosyltransferase involved in cell wall biosynthesis